MGDTFSDYKMDRIVAALEETAKGIRDILEFLKKNNYEKYEVELKGENKDE